MIIKKIHRILPIFISRLFQSDYTIILKRKPIPELLMYEASISEDYKFKKKDLSFTKNLDCWAESTTLIYRGISIAEIQTHKNRTFKFRFILNGISEWYKEVKVTNETLGISTEVVICNKFGIDVSESYRRRSNSSMRKKLVPIVNDIFKNSGLKIKEHKGDKYTSEGKPYPYDFILESGEKLSLKTNKTDDKVCPPVIGQPTSQETIKKYFGEYLPFDISFVTYRDFKEMVLQNIAKLIPLYLSYLFDTDWLLWIYKSNEGYKYELIHKSEIQTELNWDYQKIHST